LYATWQSNVAGDMKGNEMAHQQLEMKMIKWMCGVKVAVIQACNELRERPGIVKGQNPNLCLKMRSAKHSG